MEPSPPAPINAPRRTPVAEGSNVLDATPATAHAGDNTRRVIFLVEAVGAADALARVLCPFAVLQVELVFVELRRTDRGASIRIEAEGLDDHWAEVLARRLEQAPAVLSVGLGWRLGADARPVPQRDGPDGRLAKAKDAN
jgi:hypothetical protein